MINNYDALVAKLESMADHAVGCNPVVLAAAMREAADAIRDLRAERDALEKNEHLLAEHNKRLWAERDALAKDAERLDWLDKNPGKIRWATGHHGSPSNWTYEDSQRFNHDADSLRAALDVSLAAQERKL